MKPDLPYLDKPSPWSSHSRIAARLNLLPAYSRVLDVGAASGMLARMCQNRSLRLFGVEPNPDWARIAAALYEKIWIGFIDDISEESLKNYNAVVLGDILEHLSEPERVLQKLIQQQSSQCIFIISVPNIANFWVRLNLLMGRFDYTDRGILDRTHLHFFTRKTLIEMVSNAGLEIDAIHATPIPLELVSKFFITPFGKGLYAVLAYLTRLVPTFLGYQFVIEASVP
jgi:2-polyprenyl-3-methyl-5-hydroxy-6-metoxy-1,4-benzoquinol methylase